MTMDLHTVTALAVGRVLDAGHVRTPEEVQSATVTALEALSDMDRAVFADPIPWVTVNPCQDDSDHGAATVRVDRMGLCPRCAAGYIRQVDRDVEAVVLLTPAVGRRAA